MEGLGKSIVFFRSFEKLRYSNERSTKFESLYQGQKYLEEENSKLVALQISPKIESLYGLGRNFETFCELPFKQFSAENS